ncbi:MAG: imidazolonepropionase [Flavobacterium sp. BFFFF2]|nr:MAG: imidazolonepropionase [Flavobacterium sp. BFFFF2]
MARVLFTNIRELVQVREPHVPLLKGSEMAVLPIIKDAYLIIENESITDFGSMSELAEAIDCDEVHDLSGRLVLPSWCDSHTHLVYAGNRSGEFVDRIRGLSYEEIAAKGGGILNSADLLNRTSEDDLYHQSKLRLEELIRLGTGAIEIKSGYGLTVEGELKMLRVIQKLKTHYPVAIKATFLGAHAYPAIFKNNKEAYLDLVVDQMLPEIAAEGLADYVDAFLESGYFSVEDTERLMVAAKRVGLLAKIHVNQFTISGGIKTCVQHGAISVDHLEVLDDNDIAALQQGTTIPVALPGCSFFIQIPYTPGRKLIEAGLPLALASDYNPGTCPTGNMHFIVATACIQMKLTPEEAINAATLNGAYAMGLSNKYGSITKGKIANLIITKPLQSYHEIPYAFATNFIDEVYVNGEKWG